WHGRFPAGAAREPGGSRLICRSKRGLCFRPVLTGPGTNMRIVALAEKFAIAPGKAAHSRRPEARSRGRCNSGMAGPRSGQPVIMITLMVSSFLIPMVGLAIDGGRGYLVKVKLSSAVDGASLAAGRLMGTPSGASVATQTTYTTATAQQ